MSSRRASPASRRRSLAGVASSHEFLERLARILVQSGHSPQNLTREFQRICAGLKEPAHAWDPARLNYVSDLPHVLAHWHTDPQYLDSNGEPISIPLRGRGPSFSDLVARTLPEADPQGVVHSLMRLKALRRRGALYSPTDRYLAYTKQRDSALAHALTALLGMLRTVDHNISTRRGDTLLERAAMNPRFPVSALPAFRRRLRSVASEFLFSLDSDMRRRESTGRAEPTVRLGIGVFAFESPPPSTRPRAARARARRR
jgi:hypothetical protein